MRRKTLLNRNVIIVLMLFIFLMTAFVSTAYSLWYFPNSGNPKEVNADMKVDDIEENFTDTGSYLKIIDCRDGVIPDYDDFAIKSGSVFLDNSENFTDNDNTFRGKKGEDGKYRYSKKVFSVPSLKLGSLVSSVSYRSGTSITSSGTSTTDMTEIYLYDLLNSKYKLVDHLTNESIELKDGKGTSSDESYSSTKFEDYREKIGCSFSKSRILFLVPRDTKLIKKETPKVASDYNIYFHNKATSGEHDPKNGKYNYSDLDYVWLWNDRTDFGVSLPLNTDGTSTDGTINKSLHINYRTLYNAWNCDNSFKNTNETGFIMTPQTAPTGIIFKKNDGTKLVPKDKNEKTEYLVLPLPPINSTSNSTPSHFDIHIDAASNGKFTIRTDQDVDHTKNKNIVYYSANGLDHLWMWSNSPSSPLETSRWISSNYVYNFEMAGKTVSCFSYNYGEKFNFYKNWQGPAGSSAEFSSGFTFDKNEAGEKINYDYNQLVLTDYNISSQTGDIDISGLFKDTSECTSVYFIVKNDGTVIPCSSRSEFIGKLNGLK